MVPTFNSNLPRDLRNGNTIPLHSIPLARQSLLGSGMNNIILPTLSNSTVIEATRIHQMIELDAALEEIRYLNQRQQIHPSTWLNRNLLSDQPVVRPITSSIPSPLLPNPLLIPNTRISSEAFADRRRELLLVDKMFLKMPCSPPSFASSSQHNDKKTVQSQRRYLDETDITDFDVLCGRGGKSNK
jgi:hypothetical protein